ncbi:hypothetical protein NQ317_014165 [Molorchus minor]|uniref:Protein MMS22-like n=1 Tax=Molorchus minor TaxID=1323400 RepID=A0ABQ9IYH5_9CUCU|nr:hypothetical protein NQ317_014165 [Molorchus minor]
MLELNELVDTILLSQTSCNEDFEMFLSMLILHLREHPSHWGKMKGRIYSQLGPNKLKDLNEIGLTHVMTLFLALTGISFDEVPKKMISVVENLRIEQRNTNLVWNAYAVLIIIHVREGRSIEKITPLMLQMLQDAASDEKTFFLIKNFVLNFEHIIKFSKNMHLSQWLLINTWFPKYVATCYYVDLKVAMDVILYVLDSVSNSDSWLLWESSFRQYICPSLKQLSNASKAPDVIGKIAGKLFLLVPNLGSEFFNYFNSENISAKISYQFLNLILDHYPNNFGFTPQQESVVIQSWLKICLLTSNVDEHFTNNVSKLDSFPATLKQHLTNSKNPVRAFIEYLGSDVRQHALSNDIIKLCDISFGRIDKWLTNYVTHPEDEAIIFHIYCHISLAFLHCGILLYDRNKGMSPLTKLVQVVLLPNSFLIGKAPHIFILNAVKKTWHIFFEAIVKLNIIPDTFLERTLRDMIVKYMPYFSTTESPIIKCFESDITTASVILEKLSNLYFRQPVKESDANVLKALHIVSHFMQSTTSATSMTLVLNLFRVILSFLMGDIKKNVFNVERMRGVGCDENLRLLLEKLENSLK